ncbi:NUDIX hydrolase [Candidatus Collierbacteria bacterium]|nr:NUDIX hydrolase [Candidatus Collierbacteria bacterium]
MNKVVIAARIKNKEGKVLAVHLNKEKPEGVWVMPGGKLEDNESARNCVIREVKEELGLDIKPVKICGISEVSYGEGNVWIFIYFESEIISGIPTPQEENKTLEVKYIEPSDLHMSETIIWID